MIKMSAVTTYADLIPVPFTPTTATYALAKQNRIKAKNLAISKINTFCLLNFYYFSSSYFKHKDKLSILVYGLSLQ